VGLTRFFVAGLVLAVSGAPGAGAQEAHDEHDMHEHGAHVHGVGQLAIALDADGRVEAELNTPGHNVFGFEREPRNADERRIAGDARAALLSEDIVLRFNREAGCRYLGSEIAGQGEAGHDHHDAYRDVRVTVRFQCAAPERMDRVETGLFDVFGGFEEIEGVFVSTASQEGFELTPSSPAHRLSR